MLAKRDIFPILEEACPTFPAYWTEISSIHHAQSASDAPFSAALREFARHLLELHQDGKVCHFSPVAAAIRNLHQKGDNEVKSAIADLLQFIWADADWNGVDPNYFFGAESEILGELCHPFTSRDTP